jgi:hypothetical protein
MPTDGHDADVIALWRNVRRDADGLRTPLPIAMPSLSVRLSPHVRTCGGCPGPTRAGGPGSAALTYLRDISEISPRYFQPGRAPGPRATATHARRPRSHQGHMPYYAHRNSIPKMAPYYSLWQSRFARSSDPLICAHGNRSVSMTLRAAAMHMRSHSLLQACFWRVIEHIGVRA